MDPPDGMKNFTKGKQMGPEHFQPVIEWWDKREPIQVDGVDKVRRFTIEEIKAGDYNLDLCKPKAEEMELLSIEELIAGYERQRKRMNQAVDGVLAELNGIGKMGY